MGTISTLDRERSARTRESGRVRPATLRVTLETGMPETADPDAIASVHIHVSGARAPIRLYLYVDGDLADAWTDTQAVYELQVKDVKPGRHAITARAVDALGRWAGASLIFDTSDPVSILATN
jgi:hypothetical protein